MRVLCALAFAALVLAGYRPPALDRFPVRGPNGGAILPGGRVIQPAGQQFPTGTGAFGLAISPSGRSVATANLGPERASVTVLDQDRQGQWTLHNLFAALPLNRNREREFRSLSGGIAFLNDKEIWIADGQSGQVLLIDAATSTRRKVLDLNASGTVNSFPGALAYDASRNILCVVDLTHSRMVVFDTRRGVEIGSVSTDFQPYAIGLSATAEKAWITGSKSICAIDLSKPDSPRLEASVDIPGENGPSGVLVTEHAVYVSRTLDDTIYALDPATHAVLAVIPIRIPGLEGLRGVWPRAMAFEEPGQRLLVAEAGLNAVGVIDVKRNGVLGHIPVGWAPLGIAFRDGYVYVANAKGRGTGPSSILVQPDSIDFAGLIGRGSVSRFPLPGTPGAADLATQTGLVFSANGFFPAKEEPQPALPIRYVVLIVKGNRTFDEVLGDAKTVGSQVAGVGRLAIFGASGYANGGKGRFSLQNVNVTPNQHALAEQFAFSDNYYSDSEMGTDAYRWLTGEYPFVFSPQPKQDTGNLWAHLTRNDISFRKFGEPVDAAGPHLEISDQLRAQEFIGQLNENYAKTGQPLPRFLLVMLPNDFTGEPNPARGYPYRASYVADSDTALGKIVAYLSHSPWWSEMAIFVTGSGADGGRDHIDAHRTILLGVGPYLKRDYVSHTNADYPALMKTVFRLLRVPPMNLFDATAADLGDLFASEPDFHPYTFIPTDSHLFDSEPAHEK